MKLSRHLYAVLGIATVLTAVSFSSGPLKAALPAPLQVLVQNTAANPVRVAGPVTIPAVQIASGQSVGITGTPSVDINSVPAVQIASGQSVGVSSLPAVQLDSGASVAINNSTASPVNISDTANGARTPVSGNTNFLISGAQQDFVGQFYTNQSDQYLVITDVAISVSTGTAERVWFASIEGTSNGNPIEPIIPVQPGEVFFGQLHSTGTMHGAHWVFDPNTSVSATVSKTSNVAGALLHFTFSGYLTDTP